MKKLIYIFVYCPLAGMSAVLYIIIMVLRWMIYCVKCVADILGRPMAWVTNKVLGEIVYENRHSLKYAKNAEETAELMRQYEKNKNIITRQ